MARGLLVIAPFERKEVTNRTQDTTSFAAQALALGVRIEPFARGFELHASLGQDTGDLASDLWPALDDALQVFAVDAQALHFVLRNHGRFAGLTRHQRHFAEEI